MSAGTYIAIVDDMLVTKQASLYAYAAGLANDGVRGPQGTIVGWYRSRSGPRSRQIFVGLGDESLEGAART